MNDLKIITKFALWLDESYPEFGVTERIVNEFKESIMKDLFDKMEMTITKGDRKIIYDDTIGVITYYNNNGDCCQINLPITSTLVDIYKRMISICVELSLTIE